MKRKSTVQKRTKRKAVVRKTPAANEVGLLGKALRGLGGLGGGMLGSLVGQPSFGSSAGTSLGAALSRWLGAGDYTVNRNSIVMKAANNIPMMHNTGQSVVVRHREFVTQIKGSTAFAVQRSLNINPGLSGTFPWLSNLATRFQEYEFKGMVWHYVPTSGTFNGTSAALGSVMLQTTYRSTDSPPASKTEMMNEYCATEVVPFETMAHPIECDPRENPFAVHYVRNVGITSGEPLMYDIGTTFVATQGMSTTDYVGDLWVTYEVELKKPLISSPVVQTANYFATTFAGPSTSSFFAGTQGPVQGQIPGVTFTADTINFSAANGGAGIYYVSVRIYSAGGITHATQVSWAAPTPTNLSSFAYNGVATSNATIVTGTNPSTNELSVEGGYYFTDAYSDAVLTYPIAQWTAGATTYAEVIIVRLA